MLQFFGKEPLSCSGNAFNALLGMFHLALNKNLSNIIQPDHWAEPYLMWSHLSHGHTYTDVAALVTCGHTCHMWSYLSYVVILVTCGHTCHMWSNLSHVVTCGHTCHPSSHCHMWWHKVTLVTYDHTCHKKSIFQQLTKKCIRCLTRRTRPTYRPAWPQVKIMTRIHTENMAAH